MPPQINPSVPGRVVLTAAAGRIDRPASGVLGRRWDLVGRDGVAPVDDAWDEPA